MEREVVTNLYNPFAAAWGEIKPITILPAASQTPLLEEMEASIAHDSGEFMQFLQFLSSLSSASRGLLNLGHVVGACACHGGAILSKVGTAAGGPGLGLPFHYHDDGSIHYEAHEAEKPQHKPLPKTPTTVFQAPTSRQTSNRRTASGKFLAEHTRGLSHLFEPNFASLSLQQLLVS